MADHQPLTLQREREIRKQNQLNQSWAVRDLLYEVERLRAKLQCTEDDPCECCRINTEIAENA